MHARRAWLISGQLRLGRARRPGLPRQRPSAGVGPRRAQRAALIEERPGRTVAFRDLIVPDLAWHLARFAGPEDDDLLFTSPARNPMRNSNFRRRVWRPALAEAGLIDLHFHDLRHAGNVLAAAAGANLRELMERMGHSTTRAAMVCLHSTDEWQGKVADALGDLARAELGDDRKRGTVRGPSGTDLARKAARGSR
jgi:integrase